MTAEKRRRDNWFSFAVCVYSPAGGGGGEKGEDINREIYEISRAEISGMRHAFSCASFFYALDKCCCGERDVDTIKRNETETST